MGEKFRGQSRIEGDDQDQPIPDSGYNHRFLIGDVSQLIAGNNPGLYAIGELIRSPTHNNGGPLGCTRLPEAIFAFRMNNGSIGAAEPHPRTNPLPAEGTRFVFLRVQWCLLHNKGEKDRSLVNRFGFHQKFWVAILSHPGNRGGVHRIKIVLEPAKPIGRLNIES